MIALPPFAVDHGTSAAIIHYDPVLEKMRQSTSAVGAAPDWRWRLYLAELPFNDPSIAAAHVEQVEKFWATAAGRLGFCLPAPLTQPTVDGTIQLVWDRGRHYIEVDIHPDGGLEWFFKNSETGVRAGSDAREQVTALRQQLVNRLHLLRG